MLFRIWLLGTALKGVALINGKSMPHWICSGIGT